MRRTAITVMAIGALVFGLLLFLPMIHGQTAATAISGQALGQYGQPMPNAQVRVCNVTSTGTPCTPLATIYQDYGLTTPIANPYQADGFGNYSFYVGPATPNYYDVQLFPASGITWSYIYNGPQVVSGTVTSVGLTEPNIFSVAGSPVTTSGTLAVSLVTQTANTVFAGPASGGAALPTFRALTSADVPGAGSVTSVGLTTGFAELTVTGSPVTTAGTLNLAQNAPWTIAHGGCNAITAAGCIFNITPVCTADQFLRNTGSIVDCEVPFYQTIAVNGTGKIQEPELNFSTSFTCTDNSGVATNCGLTPTITAGTYIPSSITVNASGQATAITQSTAATTCAAYPSSAALWCAVLADGKLMEGGLISYSGSPGTVTVTVAVSFPTTCYSAMASQYQNYPGAGTQAQIVLVVPDPVTGFLCTTQNVSLRANGATGIEWTAVGQ